MNQPELRGESWLRDAYGFLCGLYPQHAKSDEEYRSYQVALRPLEQSSVFRAITEAVERWKWFPSAHEIHGAASEISAKARAARTARPEPDPYQQPRLHEDNPFEQIARRWEAESKMLRLDHGAPSPRTVGSARLKEIMPLIEKAFA